MTENERREDEVLKNCIQEAYGLSDEQLLAELEELEASLSDDEFVGAEDRIYARIMQREAEREDSSVSAEEAATVSENPASNPTPIRKFRKKKKWLVVGIAAALVVGASVSTIGEKNYFLKQDESKKSTVLDSGQNVVKTGDLQDAYLKIEEALDIPVLKINHLPNRLVFEELIIDGSDAFLVFSNGEHKIYFIQKQKSIERSLGINSDRKTNGKVVHNNWLSMDVFVEENVLQNGDMECSANIYNEKASYRLIGKMSVEDFSEIIMELSY